MEFKTDELVTRAVATLRQMEKIEPAKIHVNTGQIEVNKGGVTTTAMSVSEEQLSLASRLVPDLLAYLQNETELTRSTLVRIAVAVTADEV